jgi:CheY-like chemotaxis protein
MDVTNAYRRAAQRADGLRSLAGLNAGAWFAGGLLESGGSASALAGRSVSRINGSPARVLVVEDDALIALDVEQMLLDIGGLVVTVAHDEASALACLERENPDLGVLDVELGGHDSVAIARRLQATGKPFVFLTGYQSSSKALLRGAPVLEKPFSDEALADVVRRLLNGD